MRPNFKDISLTLYGISLITPIFIGAWWDIGMYALTMGWLGVLALEYIYAIPWIANIFYFVGILLPFRNLKIKLILSIFAFACGLFALGITESPRIEGNIKVYPGVGMFLWLLSFISLIIYYLNLVFLTRKEKPDTTSNHSL